jgi:hypothetical protein
MADFEWTEPFLAALKNTPNVSGACRSAGISRRAAYDHRDRDDAFARAWDDALAESTDDLVGECYRRAKDGTARPVFYKGDECGAIREFSDTLAIFLLKNHRPEVYSERVKTDVTSNGQTVQTVIYLPENGRDTPDRDEGDPPPGRPADGVPGDAG